MIRPNVRAGGFVITALFALVISALVVAGSSHAVGAETASPWVDGPSTKARLIGGGSAAEHGAKRLAFVEIALEPGWKTYWRTPGDAGGLPPSFDWSKSANLAQAEVLYPAPKRFVDRSGTTIGYEGGLVLPVEVTPQSADQPVSLVVALHYGICKNVCVPVEAELALDLKPGAEITTTEEGVAALARVPRGQDKLGPKDPALISAEAELEGAAPRIRIAARFPEEGTATAFLEAPDGLFLPVPEPVAAGAGGVRTFEAPLGSDVDIASLKGKTVTVTLVGESGASTATFRAD